MPTHQNNLSILIQSPAQTCKDADICSDNAQCVYDPILEEHVCECMDEFSGDGYNCESAMAGKLP